MADPVAEDVVASQTHMYVLRSVAQDELCKYIDLHIQCALPNRGGPSAEISRRKTETKHENVKEI